MNHMMQLMNSGHHISSLSLEDDLAGLTITSFTFFAYLSSQSWIINIGANDYMCAYITLMHSVETLPHPVYIFLPTQVKILVHKVGSVVLTPELTIHNVFFVPSFHYNLLSISKLTKESNFEVLFLPNKCLF